MVSPGRYTAGALITGLTLLVLSGCPIFTKKSNEKFEAQQTIFAPNVDVISSGKNILDLINNFDPRTSTQITFVQYPDIQQGTKIISGPLKNAPQGIPPELVMSVSPDGRTLSVKRIPLEELVEYASVKNWDITPKSQMITIDKPDGTTVEAYYKHGSLNIHYSLGNLVWKDKNGNPLIMKGSFDLLTKFLLSYDIRNLHLKDLYLEANMEDLGIDLQLYSPDPIEIDSNKKVTFYFGPEFVLVGGIPFEIDTYFNTIIHAKGRFSKVDEVVGQHFSAHESLSFDGSWQNSLSFSSHPHLSGITYLSNGSISFEMRPEIRFYNLPFGIFTGVGIGAELMRGNHNSHIPGKLYGFFNLHSGLDPGIFSAFIKPFDETLIDKSWLLAKEKLPEPEKEKTVKEPESKKPVELPAPNIPPKKQTTSEQNHPEQNSHPKTNQNYHPPSQNVQQSKSRLNQTPQLAQNEPKYTPKPSMTQNNYALPQKTQYKPPKTVSNKLGLEDLFLQGKELNGLTVTGTYLSGGSYTGVPQIDSPQEIQNLKMQNPFMKGLEEMGDCSYIYPQDKYDSIIRITPFKFDDSEDLKSFINALGNMYLNSSDGGWLVVKEDMGAVIRPYVKRGSGNLAKTEKNMVISSLQNYFNRLNPDLYLLTNNGQIWQKTNKESLFSLIKNW